MTGIAQIGFGYWGPNLARNLDALIGGDWRYLVETRPERRVVAAERYPHVRVTGDLDAVLADPAVQAVVLATPAGTHTALARRALAAGKHVLVEKPLTLSTVDAVDVTRMADERGLVLMTGHTFEFVPAVRRMRELIQSGTVGNLLYLHSQRLNLGRIQSEINAFWSIGPHDVSIANFLTGSTPRWVSAQGASFLRTACEDVTFVTVGYDSGALAHLHVSWLDPQKVRRVTVVGSSRMLVYDDLDVGARLKVFDSGTDQIDFDPQGLWEGRTRAMVPEVAALDPIEPLAAEIGHFLDCVRTNKRPDTDGWNGVRVVAVCEAVDASLRAGGARVEVNTPEEALL